MDNLDDHFWRKPTEYHSYYNFRHLGYVNIICVTLSVIFNIFMVLVLTRKSMISPINTILAHYIVTETLAALGYTARTIHEHFRVELCSIPKHNTKTWELISYYSYCWGFIFRHIGVWQAMMIAVWRYIAVMHPFKERQYCDMENTQKLILAGYVTVIMLSIPPFFATGVAPAVKLLDQSGCMTKNSTIGQNVTIYEFQIFLEDYLIWYTLGLYAYGIFVKIMPSVIFAIISIKVIRNLLAMKRRRQKMVTTSNRNNSYNKRMERQIRQTTDRTTYILLVILTLFVVGEVPHGVFAFLTAFYGPKFFWTYYYYAMEVFNSATHVAEVFNFVVFYSLSRQFRSTFKSLFISNPKSNSKTVSPQRSTSSLPGINKLQHDFTSSSSIVTISSSMM